jgi:hypothetical protein
MKEHKNATSKLTISRVKSKRWDLFFQVTKPIDETRNLAGLHPQHSFQAKEQASSYQRPWALK